LNALPSQTFAATATSSQSKVAPLPSAVNQTIRKVISSPFTEEHRLGYITVNPCSGVELLRDDADTEKDVFTRKQIAKLFQTAEGEWQGAILMGYLTGLRLGDITKMRRQSVDLESGLLKVKTGKIGKTVA